MYNVLAYSSENVHYHIKSDFRSLLNVFYFLFVLQESENLEKENAALRKEVKRLTEEAKYLSTVLSNHEPLCTGLSGASTEILYGAHHGAFHQHISVPHYPL